MVNPTPTADSGKKAQTGILILAIALILLLLFGTQRQPVAQGFVTTTAGSSAETGLIDTAGQRSPSIEIITQLQYTQRVLFKAELLDSNDNVIAQTNQALDSRYDSSTERLNIENWPNPERIKVRLTVSEQSITSQPPAGVSADTIPVIFEVNVYRQWLRGSFLLPGFLACLALWFIVGRARQKANS